jgi:hypothetical protein
MTNLTEALLARHSEAMAAKTARLALESSDESSGTPAESSDLSPAVSAPPVRATTDVAKPDLSPAVQFARLKPHDVISLPDRTIYTFWKIGGVAKSMYDLRDRANPRMCATITRYRDDTFILAFYPNDGDNQVSKKLKASDLHIAVQDLIDCGF